MPDFVPVLHSIEFRITGVHTASGKKVFNIGHTDCASPLPTQSEVQDTVDAVSAWVIASYKSLFHSSIVVQEVRARSNAEEPGPFAINATISQAGALAGDQLPLAQALCVNEYTGATGASRRGRWFVFPADETVQTNGLYTAGYIGGATTVMGLLVTELDGVGQAYAVESRRHLTLYQINGFVAQAIPSSLASRKPNRGI